MNNVEKIVIAWLETVLGDAVPVFGDKPKDLPDADTTYVLVDRTGGGREAMVMDRAEILIEVYNKDSRVAASDQAQAIADVIRNLTAYNDDITHASVNSLIKLDDIIGQNFRYQIYCDVYCRR